MIKQLNDLLEIILREYKLDWRSCYTNVVSLPPDGRVVSCECSDGGVLSELQKRMAAVPSPSVDQEISYVLLPEESEARVPGLIAVSSVADVRRQPDHASELLTQVIYGDCVEPLKEAGEWYLVRIDDGYVGWIRSWHVCVRTPAEQAAFRSAAAHRICANNAVLLENPDETALPVSDLVVGTIMEVKGCGRRGWRRARLADGKAGYVKSRSVERLPRRKRLSRQGLATTGMRFLGIPYIWGGTTPKGFDCSGLMQRIFRLNGLLIPRDADLQSRFGREKPVGRPEALVTGDLMFFGASGQKITHVAMVLPEGLFLHAYGQVRVGSLDPLSSLYDARLLKDWRITRDPISG